jgi:glycosyltransferase involved in cell wall biosynthesis
VLTDGLTARLVAPDDVAGAAAALRGLLRDAALCARLSAAARDAGARYTWHRRATRIVEFLSDA